ncbi:MAG TPA: hypothetical protein VFO62_02565 [Candidatus Binatia bacterium]|nr:hypothetical protein [Candidatus Binatia bacterium]
MSDRATRRIVVLAGMMSAALACISCRSEPLVTVFHEPSHFDRRAGAFSANVTGILADEDVEATYSLNGAPARTLPQGGHRAPPPRFIVEMEGTELREGPNRLELHARSGRHEQRLAYDFTYDPTPPKLPIELDWEHAPIMVEDGQWERFRTEAGEWRVRSKLGDEGYDRVIVFAGAFSGARRIETDMIFRYRVETGEWGFGLLPLWGGRPDEPTFRPKRGWLFSLAWFFERQRGVGNEFSQRKGEEPWSFTTAYHDLEIEPNVRYRVITETWPETDAAGAFTRYFQRMKWWPADEPEPVGWIVLADDQRLPLPEGEYGVAFVCYRSQVDIGRVRITAL